jgi:hypothetical protein
MLWGSFTGANPLDGQKTPTLIDCVYGDYGMQRDFEKQKMTQTGRTAALCRRNCIS